MHGFMKVKRGLLSVSHVSVSTYSCDPLRLVRLSSSTTSPDADPEDPSGDKGEADVSKAATETVSRKQARKNRTAVNATSLP